MKPSQGIAESAKKKQRTNQTRDLHSRAVTGAFWNIFFALANKVFTLGGQVALAWFLLPADMGLANTAQAMGAFAMVLSINGLSNVLIQRGNYEEEAGQALWAAFIFALATSGTIVLVGVLSPSLGRPAVRDLLLALALTNFIDFPLAVLSAGLRNRLDFKGLAFSQFAGGVVYTASAIFLAWKGLGPYSLIFPFAPKSIVTLGIAWARVGKIMGGPPQWDKIWTLVRPSFSLSLSGFFFALRYQAPVFVCGLTLNPAETGYFSWGWLVASQSVFLLATNLREVLLPTFARIRNNPGRRLRAALQAAHVMTSLLCVACGAQALLAGPLIKLFVPVKWFPAIPVVLVASLGLLFQGLWSSGTAWLNAEGRYGPILKLNAQQAVLVAGLTWLGVALGGMMGATLGCALASLGGAALCLFPMGREVLIPQIGYWLRPLGMSASLWLACFFTTWGRGPIPQIFSAVVFTGLSGWIWWREDRGGLRFVVRLLAEKITAYSPGTGKRKSTAPPTS